MDSFPYRSSFIFIPFSIFAYLLNFSSFSSCSFYFSGSICTFLWSLPCGWILCGGEVTKGKVLSRMSELKVHKPKMCAGNIFSIAKTLFKKCCWENQRNFTDSLLWMRCLKKTQQNPTNQPQQQKPQNQESTTLSKAFYVFPSSIVTIKKTLKAIYRNISNR